MMLNAASAHGSSSIIAGLFDQGVACPASRVINVYGDAIPAGIAEDNPVVIFRAVGSSICSAISGKATSSSSSLLSTKSSAA